MEKNYEEVKKLLKENREKKEYRLEYLKRVLNEKENLRKTFIGVIINEPARKQEIQEINYLTPRTTYTCLYQLISLGLIKKVPIMDIWNLKSLNETEKKIIKKFKEWTKTMADGQKQYFAAKTHYWVITELGKDKNLLNWVCKLDSDKKKLNNK